MWDTTLAFLLVKSVVLDNLFLVAFRLESIVTPSSYKPPQLACPVPSSIDIGLSHLTAGSYCIIECFPSLVKPVKNDASPSSQICLDYVGQVLVLFVDEGYLFQRQQFSDNARCANHLL
jgi:hypothetical protein